MHQTAAALEKTFTISDLAEEFGVTTRTIRFYEEKGLLNPKRDGQHRVYRAGDRTKLRLILRGKRLGFSLGESAEIILMYGSPGNNRRQLETLLERIEGKRAELVARRRELDAMLAEMEQAERRCQAALDNLESDE
jgi:DNA-binding transcriptional MerR regulator